MSGDWGPWYFYERIQLRHVPEPPPVVGPLRGTWYEARQEASALLDLEPDRLAWSQKPVIWVPVSLCKKRE